MVNRTTKLRWRRRFRRGRQHVEGFGVQAEDTLERHFVRRLNSLLAVRRFVFAWLLLMVVLISTLVVQARGLSQYYQVNEPVPGGTFTEGLIGAFTNANPLYATTTVDSSVARLIFSGLLRYDQNGQLVGDLAESWQVDDRGTHYTVNLRKNLKWHDGEPLTAEDVIFTYQTIQNPDAKSPLLSSWRDIMVEAPNPSTVIFSLPNSLSSFPHSLTNGIVPKHLLADISPAQLRSDRFNTLAPIGSGPFKWETIEVEGGSPDTREERIALVPNSLFYRERAKLQRFVIRAFRDEQKLLESLENRELNGAVGLDSLPDNLTKIKEIHTYNVPINGEVLVFFKTTFPILNDAKVRQALVKAVNTKQVIKNLGYPVIAANGPLLASHIGYTKDVVQFPQNVEEANQILDAAGWARGSKGLRGKGGVPLTFQLYSQDTADYAAVTGALQKQWRAIGVDARVVLQSDSELQATISGHDYEALLFGLSTGPDPDVFPFWHSSQADPRSANRLNLSEYQSKQADAALEAGRTRSDSSVRAAKYRPFLEAWRNDAPALALYQPRLLYVAYGGFFGFELKVVNVAADRYANVENWMILQEKANK